MVSSSGRGKAAAGINWAKHRLKGHFLQQNICNKIHGRNSIFCEWAAANPRMLWLAPLAAQFQFSVFGADENVPQIRAGSRSSDPADWTHFQRKSRTLSVPKRKTGNGCVDVQRRYCAVDSRSVAALGHLGHRFGPGGRSECCLVSDELVQNGLVQHGSVPYSLC